MTTIDIEKVRQRQDQNQDKEKHELPPQYVIVLHANPGSKDLLIAFAIVHVLVDHLNMPRQEAVSIVTDALRRGRRVIRTVTKDVGETVMDQINDCELAGKSTDYKRPLETA